MATNAGGKAEQAGDWEAAFDAYCHLFILERPTPELREKLNAALRRVHLEVAGGEHRLARLADGALGVPERHAEPGEQLADAERLGDVVIGASVERRDLVGLLAARREHDDRHGRPLA